MMKGPPSDSPEGEEKEKGKVKNAIRTATPPLGEVGRGLSHFSLLTLHLLLSPLGELERGLDIL